MEKKRAMEIFGQLWEQYVECPKSELTKDALELREELKSVVGVGDTLKEEHLRLLIFNALTTDGAHHKQWYLYKIAKRLGFNRVKMEHAGIDKGIAP